MSKEQTISNNEKGGSVEPPFCIYTFNFYLDFIPTQWLPVVLN